MAMRDLFDHLTEELQFIGLRGEGADELVVEAAKAHALGRIADGLQAFKDLDLQIGNPILDVASAINNVAEAINNVAEAIRESE